MDAYTNFPCDLCGSWEAVEVPYARLYTNDQAVHICKDCGFVYVKSRRSPEAIARSWSEELFGKNYTARIPAVKARQTYVADFLDVSIGLKDKLLVDIGAGEGQFLEIVTREYGAKVFGIEPSSVNCENMNNAGFDCFEGTIEDYAAFEDSKKADVVSILWTLENCCSCRDMLDAAHDILKDGGYVTVATGSRLLTPFKKAIWNYLSANPADTHSFRFSPNTLSGLLAKTGFEVTHINRHQDTDYLQVVAVKRPKGTEIPWQGDNYLKVHNFFERWHSESVHYCLDE